MSPVCIYEKMTRKQLSRVAPLGAVNTNLCDELKMHHVEVSVRENADLKEGTVF